MILISACLLGEKVRYDGQSKPLLDPIIVYWQQQELLFSLCPEVSGGLPIPRAAAEIIPLYKTIQIININGNDVTKAFLKGAEIALNHCQQKKIRMAILTESSPSCGSQKIHNGKFDGQTISGQGITTRLLEKNSIKVFNQHQLPQAFEYYKDLYKP